MRHPRRADIQGLRAVAVLLVIVFHSGLPLPGGFTGVDVFFAISGFVITGTLVRELAASDRLGLTQFYVRRVKRLLPALATMLVVVAAVGFVATPVATARIGPLTGIFASLFSSNGYLYSLHTGYFETSGMLNPLLHTWTLAVEEQFYVVFPVLLLLVWRLARRRASARVGRLATALVVTAVGVVSLGLAFTLPAQLAFFGSPTRAWEFAAGALASLLAPQAGRIGRRSAIALGAVGAAAIAATAGLSTDADQTALAALPAVAGACSLLVAGTATGAGLSRWLAARPMVWIGDLSYSLYLWHWPLIVFAAAVWPLAGWAPPAAAAASLLPAWLSYRYVENPVRSDARIRGRRAVALAGACIAAPAGVCAVWLVADDRLIGSSPALASVRASQQPTIGALRQCIGPFRPGSAATDRCTWAVPQPAGRAVLLGDSIATTLGEPFVAAVNHAGLDATIASKPGCAFLDARLTTTAVDERGCRAYYDASIEQLVLARPRLVVLAHISTYIEDPRVVLAAAAGGPHTRDPRAKAALWRAGVASAIARLNAAHVPVLVVLSIPFLRFSPSECAVGSVLAGACDGGASRAAVGRQRGSIVAADRSAVTGSRDATTIDLIDRLCASRTCPSTRDGVVLYSDRFHPSAGGGRRLTASFGRALAVAERRSARLR